MKKIVRLIFNFLILIAVYFFVEAAIRLWLISMLIFLNFEKRDSYLFFVISALILMFLQANNHFSSLNLIFFAYSVVMTAMIFILRKIFLSDIIQLDRLFKKSIRQFRKDKRHTDKLKKEKESVKNRLDVYQQLYSLSRILETCETFDKLREELKFWLRSQGKIRRIYIKFVHYFQKIFEYEYRLLYFGDNRVFKKFSFSDAGIRMEILSEAESRNFLIMFFHIISIEIQRIHLTEQVKRYSITDSLTDLYVQRHLKEILQIEIKRCNRYKEIFSIAMIDIDNFKGVNDKYGHIIGDSVLKGISNIFLKNIKTGVERVGRYGGEEFLILLSGQSKKQALSRLNTMINLVRNADFKGIRATISAGIAEFPKDASAANELIECADMVLYEAKNTGKNKVVLYGI